MSASLSSSRRHVPVPGPTPSAIPLSGLPSSRSIELNCTAAPTGTLSVVGPYSRPSSSVARTRHDGIGRGEIDRADEALSAVGIVSRRKHPDAVRPGDLYGECLPDTVPFSVDRADGHLRRARSDRGEPQLVGLDRDRDHFWVG